MGAIITGTERVGVELGGEVGLVAHGRRVESRALRASVPRRVLAVLALERRPVSRDELGDAVWGEDLPRTWETALRGAVHQLRRAVAEVAPGAPPLITTAFGCYQLDPAASVDLLDAIDAVESAEALLAGGDALGALAAAAGAEAVLGAQLLAGLDGEWLERTRRRLAGTHLRGLLVLSAASTACGQHGRAVEAAEAALGLEPLQEQAHRQLMAAHAAGGDRAAALVAYRRCRELLEAELGVVPSAQTEAVRAALAATAPVAPVVLPATLDQTLPLVGRDPELRALQASWDAVGRGGGGTVAVLGAAGSGKSRLAAEVASSAHRGGAPVAHARFDPDDLGALSALGGALGQLGVAWPPPGAVLDRASLLAAARRALRQAASGPGLLVVLDDVHWADRPSLALLADLAAEPVPGLLLVLTARDDWLPPALAELLERVDRVEIGPLDTCGTAALIGAWAGHDAATTTVETIHRRSGGNPFFVTAVLQDLADRGIVDLASGVGGLVADDLPTSVPELVASAVERCGPDAAGLALLAAVLGDEFRGDVLAEATDRAPGVVAATLERLAHVRVLGRGGDDRRFRFVHALVRRSILDAADPESVRAAHRDAASAIARRASGAPDLLPHLLAARDGAELRTAIDLAVAQAGELIDAGAVAEALDLLERVLAWAEEARAADLDRVPLLLAVANAEMSRDRLVEGRRAMCDAARIAVAAGDASAFGADLFAVRPPSIAEHDPATIELVEQLLDLVEPGSGGAVAVRSWLAAEVGSLDPARGTEAAALALADADRLGDAALQQLAGLAWHLMGRAVVAVDERRATLERLRALPPSPRSRIGRATLEVFLAGDRLEVGDRAGAVASIDAALSLTAGTGPTHVRWLALRNQVLLHVLDGELDRADEVLQEATAVAGHLPIPEAMLYPVLQQVVTRFHQGRLDELHPLVAAVAASAPVDGPATIVDGWMAAHLGTPGADAAVDRAVAVALRAPRNAGWVGLTAVTTEAAAIVGHPRTSELAGTLEPLSGHHALIVTIGYLGAVDRVLALAARAAGDEDRAAVLFERAQAQHEAVGAACYLARTERERVAADPAA